MSLLANLRAGVRLATFGQVESADFHVGPSQLAGLVTMWLGVAFACSWVLTEPPRWFDASAFESQALGFAFILGFCWLAAREADQPRAVLAIAIAYLSTEPVTWLAYTATHLGWQALLGIEPWYLAWAIWISMQLWEGAIAYRAVRMVCDLEPLRAGAMAGLYVGAAMWLAFALPASNFFLTDTWSDQAGWEEEEEIDAEGILHAQHDLVQQALGTLEPSRPGLPELYFVAFGADSTQDVFRSEVEYTQELFDRRFDTTGRSLGLLNHAETLWSQPLASASNLGAVLEGVAQRMDVEEDVLFLYLTGHGSKEHELAVRHPGLPLNYFGPDRLAEMLDASGIKWRVVVVSACYSGGFVEPLEDERTLVLTASAEDRRSFGCGNESEFTYFGRALFAEQLTQRFSFADAFEAARESIQERELAEEKEPSLPRMSAGEPILAKLVGIEARLSRTLPALADAGGS